MSITASGHKFGLVPTFTLNFSRPASGVKAFKADGWHVPAYSLPPNLEHGDVIRVVCRQGCPR